MKLTTIWWWSDWPECNLDQQVADFPLQWNNSYDLLRNYGYMQCHNYWYGSWAFSCELLWKLCRKKSLSNRWRCVHRVSVREMKQKLLSVGLLSPVFIHVCAYDSSEISEKERQARVCMRTMSARSCLQSLAIQSRGLSLCSLISPVCRRRRRCTHTFTRVRKITRSYELAGRFQCIPFWHSLYTNHPAWCVVSVHTSLTISSNSKTIRAKLFKK